MGEKIFQVTARWSDRPTSKDLGHVALHIMKTAGKIAALAERMEEDGKHFDDDIMLNGVVMRDLPDLVIEAAMAADILESNLNFSIHERSANLAANALGPSVETVKREPSGA